MNKTGIAEPVTTGVIRSVSQDVLCLSLPMIGASLSLPPVNCWIIGNGQDRLIADTGMPYQHALTAWQAGTGLVPPASVRDVVCTHMHRDHTGQASYLVRHHGARLHMTPREHATLKRSAAESDETAIQARLRLLRLAGAKPDDSAMATRPLSYRDLADIPDDYAPLQDGAVVRLAGRDWHTILGGGHSPEAACLYAPSDDLFIAGDQILPDAVPHISVGADDPDADPLGQYFAFLNRLGDIPDTALVLPGHGAAFRGLQGRIKALETAHRKRSLRLLAAATQPMRCVDLVPHLFRPSATGPLRYLMIAMTMAQLNYLLGLGKVEREPGEDGAFVYRAVPAKSSNP